MRNRRRNWLLRRLVLGLAVAAIAAPTALAGVDEGGTAQSDGVSSAVIQGDDKVIVADGGGLLVQGDDKVFAPESGGVLVKGDDKVIATADWQYNQFAYRHGMPQDYRGDFATQVKDSEPIQVRGSHPLGRGLVTTATGTGTADFNWGDGLIGAAAALGLALLAFGAARSTRGMGRPATN